MDSLRFEEEGHRYFYGRRELPSVTRILRALNLIDERPYPYTSDYLKEFGKAVHTICALWSMGEHERVAQLLDRKENEVLHPRLTAWQGWCEHTGFVADHVELLVCDPVFGFAGRLDVLGHWSEDERAVLVDWKTGKVEWWVALQTAAYARAARAQGLFNRPCVRIGLELRDNGRAYPTPYRPPNNDDRLWLSAMALYHAKAEGTGGKLP